ncbi:hypothetical protein NXX09_14620 [Bacteroides uniformis]|nr:hypothetical protein [Bacteroides uniformis]
MPASFVLQDSPIAPQPQDSASEAVPTKRNKRLEKVVKAAERLLEEEGVSYCEHHHNEYVMRMGYLLNQVRSGPEDSRRLGSGALS